MEEFFMSHMPKGRIEATTILEIGGGIWAWKQLSRAICPKGELKQPQSWKLEEEFGHRRGLHE